MASTKYIFISGGVLSGLGKGVTTGSIALLLKSRGYKVTPIKCENYLNIDAGLINPIEHGDTFLCNDGAETDMDIGTYERFLDVNLSMDNFITMGQIYKTVIEKERNFEYLGEDVEAVPHVTDEIIKRIKKKGRKDRADIVIIELGGTAGEYQNILYYEAARIMKTKHQDTILHIHVSYLPTPSHIGEPKTKPTQLSVKQLNSMGIQPDFIVARSDKVIDKRRKERLALFCSLSLQDIISSPNLKEVYELPLIFQQQQFDKKILKKINLPYNTSSLKSWEKLNSKFKNLQAEKVTIAIVGKYFATGKYHLTDSYAALIDALRHAAWQNNKKLKFQYINSEKTTAIKLKQKLKVVDGIVVPIGWGLRGTKGMIQAINYARVNKIPFLGLCYGMQMAVVEIARNLAGLKNAHSTEINPQTPHPVVHIIPKQQRNIQLRAYGGTMRLGSWDCKIKKDTLAWKIYKQSKISERHRHRYEVNKKYLKILQKTGLIISARSVKESLIEIIELPEKIHPFFLGIQGHPEYKSRPLNPHPIFVEFIKASNNRVNK